MLKRILVDMNIVYIGVLPDRPDPDSMPIPSKKTSRRRRKSRAGEDLEKTSTPGSSKKSTPARASSSGLNGFNTCKMLVAARFASNMTIL